MRLDSETVARVRYAGLLRGGTAVSSSAPLVAGGALVLATPLVMAVLNHREDKARELQERLKECARLAERQVNGPLFGDRDPTPEECGEELDVDGCDEPITRAMLLGRQKHDIALACAREVLKQLWPAPFSIEPRYRYYQSSRFLETISSEKEQRLIAQGCTKELWRTIKPDIVLHADGNLLQAVLIIDFKFPCPPSKDPTWKWYGKTSAYDGLTQGDVYKQALGGEVLLLSPRGFF